MANSALTPDIITKEALDILHNNLVFCRKVNRQYDDSNEMGGQKNSGAIRIRLPNKYTTSTGAALSIEDTTEQSVTLPAGTQRHVDTNFTTKELTLDIDTFSERILEPGISTLASMVDYTTYQARMLDIANTVGTAGTTPATAAVLLDANTKMSNFATPTSRRCTVVNPAANGALVDGLKGLFHSGGSISDQYKSGMMGTNVLGYEEIAMSQSVATLTHGTRALADTTLVNGTLSTEGGATISVDGGTASATIVAGDVFTVANVFSVNPETKVSTGQLQQFVCTATNTATTGAWTDIAISPAIYTTTALQNVDSFPQDGAAVTFVGTESTTNPINLAFHKDTFIMATTDLEMPEGVHFSSRQVMDGISMRLVRQYRIGTDDIPTRIDLLYASVTARPETGCRIMG